MCQWTAYGGLGALDTAWSRAHPAGMMSSVGRGSLALLLASPASVAGGAPPVRPPPPEAGLELPGNYLHISPGIGGVIPIPDVGVGAHAWGLGAGHHFTRGSDLAIDFGGFGEHLVVFILPGEDGGRTTVEHAVRVGPELRVGVRSPHAFAYGLARVGLELLIDSSLDPTRRVTPWVMGMLGGGVQGLLGRRFLLGGEGGIDYGGATFVMVRLRLMVGVRF